MRHIQPHSTCSPSFDVMIDSNDEHIRYLLDHHGAPRSPEADEMYRLPWPLGWKHLALLRDSGLHPGTTVASIHGWLDSDRHGTRKSADFHMMVIERGSIDYTALSFFPIKGLSSVETLSLNANSAPHTKALWIRTLKELPGLKEIYIDCAGNEDLKIRVLCSVLKATPPPSFPSQTMLGDRPLYCPKLERIVLMNTAAPTLRSIRKIQSAANVRLGAGGPAIKVLYPGSLRLQDVVKLLLQPHLRDGNGLLSRALTISPNGGANHPNAPDRL
ncbi:hypothetical protein C8Q77DRAFT_1097183 [Trametes polyzona]|nr:hypothetical protein C8Q77DRAFT_1097183 [Trametes polyzona]